MAFSSCRGIIESAAEVSAATLLAACRSMAAAPSGRVRAVVIGSGNQGKAHFRSLSKLLNAEIACVADVDQNRLDDGAKMPGGAPVAGFRILDDASVDAVGHWRIASGV